MILLSTLVWVIVYLLYCFKHIIICFAPFSFINFVFMKRLSSSCFLHAIPYFTLDVVLTKKTRSLFILSCTNFYFATKNKFSLMWKFTISVEIHTQMFLLWLVEDKSLFQFFQNVFVCMILK